MKALKIIGLAVLIIIVAAGIAAGGYFLAVWHTNDKTQTETKTTSDTTTNTTRPAHELAPAKATALTTCNADELSLSTAESSQSGVGTLAIDLVFTNTGKRDCILGGFPGVSLVNDNGNQVGKPADRATNSVEKTVTLKPGGAAMATLYYEDEGNFDDGECTEGATKIRAYAPNDAGYVSIAQTAVTAWCPGFEVSPIF